jgi:hypothetical protein
VSPGQVLADHTTRARSIQGGHRWEALCSCGWRTPPLRWKVSALDASTGHLLEVQS